MFERFTIDQNHYHFFDIELPFHDMHNFPSKGGYILIRISSLILLPIKSILNF